MTRGLISPEDRDLFFVTEDVNEAVDEITAFYSNYHSLRFVDGDLVLRMHNAPGVAELALHRVEPSQRESQICLKTRDRQAGGVQLLQLRHGQGHRGIAKQLKRLRRDSLRRHGQSCAVRARHNDERDLASSRTTTTAASSHAPQPWSWWISQPSGRSRTMSRVLSNAASGVGR